MGSYQNNKKSPSFHSNKSENMSVDANLNNSQLLSNLNKIVIIKFKKKFK